MGIARFFGAVLSLCAAYWVFTYLNGEWSLGVQRLVDFKEIGAKGYGALAISLVAGFVGLLIGQGIGGAVKIDSDDLATHLTVSWHYLANTTIYWMLAGSFAVSVALGDSAESFFSQHADEFFIRGLVISAVGGITIAWVNYFAAQVAQRGNPLGILIIKLFPIAAGITMALAQLSPYRINSIPAMVAGFILPFVIIPLSGKMWRKDMLLRSPYLRF
jgi:hypothetical protein